MNCTECGQKFLDGDIINIEASYEDHPMCDGCHGRGMELDREYTIQYAHACGYSD